MSTVIYLANQQIQVVTGSLKNRKICIENRLEAEAPEGSIINGIVMDTELFIEFMKEFKTAHKLPVKDVILVINSTKFTGKTIEMPELNEKKTAEFIVREFADLQKENCLYSYLPLGAVKGKTKRVYAESIEPDFIKDYIDIFREIGIQLKSIVSGESSLIGLTAMTIGAVQRTFSLIIADSNILTTILWIDGSFYYFNNTRCFHEQETEEYAADVARSVSQIVQFMQAHQIEQQMESIVIAGIDRDNLSMYQRAVAQMGIQTPVQVFEASTLVASGETEGQKCLRSAGGLAINLKHQDFLKQYTLGAKKKNGAKKHVARQVIVILVVFLFVLIAVVSLYMMLLSRKAELRQLDEYNSSPEIINSISEYDMQSNKNRYLNAQRDAITSLNDHLLTYPVFDSGMIAQIEACAKGYATVSVEAFDAAEGTIQMTASSDSVDQINRFISKLNANEIFETVNYTGYTYNDSTSNWDINVTCTLAEAAGR